MLGPLGIAPEGRKAAHGELVEPPLYGRGGRDCLSILIKQVHKVRRRCFGVGQSFIHRLTHSATSSRHVGDYDAVGSPFPIYHCGIPGHKPASFTPIRLSLRFGGPRRWKLSGGEELELFAGSRGVRQCRGYPRDGSVSIPPSPVDAGYFSCWFPPMSWGWHHHPHLPGGCSLTSHQPRTRHANGLFHGNDGKGSTGFWDRASTS